MRHLAISTFLAASAMAATPVAAGCPDGFNDLMSCTFRNGAKEVSVCLLGQSAIYRFGPTNGKPELLLKRWADEVGYIPWGGVGRSIWEEFTFTNKGVAYVVWYSIDRLVKGNPITGGVVVREGEKELARLECDAGSVGGVLYDAPLLGDALESAGLSWCWDVQEWRDACG